MMNTISIRTETALDIMRRNPFDLDITDETRAALSQLCNVESVGDASLPRAIIEHARPHLRTHIPWLTAALDYLQTKQEGCPTCDIDHTNDEAMRQCPLNHAVAGLLMLYGESWDVPPLPEDQYTQSDDEFEEMMTSLPLLMKELFITEHQLIAVLLADQLETKQQDDTYRWN
jgi:hypothetical protein